jgi:hemerythrin-like metal-binding protein
VEYRIVRWDDSYSVGIGPIDDQHKQLLILCNNLWISSYRTDDFSRSFFRQNVYELVNYADYHIYEEEQLLARAGYPDLRSHKKEHSKIAAFLNRYLLHLGAGEDLLIRESIPEMQKQILNHITGSDRGFANYVRSLQHPRYVKENRLPTEIFFG